MLDWPFPGMQNMDPSPPIIEDRYSSDRREFFRRAFIAVGFNGITGDYAEFGCHTGTTFKLAYEESTKAAKHVTENANVFVSKRRLWAFDSFQGLPASTLTEDEHPAWREGTLCTTLEQFHTICANNKIPRNDYETVPGFYEVSLVDNSLSRAPADIALAFVDCDLYSSISTVLRFLLTRLKQGMILALDDYHCYSNTQVSGARRASVEVFGANPDWRLVPYVQFGWSGMSYIVESKKLLPDPVGL